MVYKSVKLKQASPGRQPRGAFLLRDDSTDRQPTRIRQPLAEVSRALSRRASLLRLLSEAREACAGEGGRPYRAASRRSSKVLESFEPSIVMQDVSRQSQAALREERRCGGVRCERHADGSEPSLVQGVGGGQISTAFRLKTGLVILRAAAGDGRGGYTSGVMGHG